MKDRSNSRDSAETAVLRLVRGFLDRAPLKQRTRTLPTMGSYVASSSSSSLGGFEIAGSESFGESIIDRS